MAKCTGPFHSLLHSKASINSIGFARDLSSQVSYRSNQPSALEPLTNPNIFSRWIDMERKFAFEKVDEVMCGEGAWESDTDGIVPR